MVDALSSRLKCVLISVTSGFRSVSRHVRAHSRRAEHLGQRPQVRHPSSSHVIRRSNGERLPRNGVALANLLRHIDCVTVVELGTHHRRNIFAPHERQLVALRSLQPGVTYARVRTAMIRDIDRSPAVPAG